jgi:hypothetical protein
MSIPMTNSRKDAIRKFEDHPAGMLVEFDQSVPGRANAGDLPKHLEIEYFHAIPAPDCAGGLPRIDFPQRQPVLGMFLRVIPFGDSTVCTGLHGLTGFQLGSTIKPRMPFAGRRLAWTR